MDTLGEMCNLALREQQAGRMAEAEKGYRLALAIDPNCVAALNNLGTILSDRTKWAAAEVMFRRAIALEAEVKYMSNLATTLMRMCAYEEAEQVCWKILEKDEGDYIAWRTLGLCAFHKGEDAASVEYFRKSLHFRPGDKGIESDRAIAWLAQGRYDLGFEHFRARWMLVGKRPIFKSAVPLWNGEHLAGRTILVHHEQGFGDTIHFIRFLPLLREKKQPDKIIFAALKETYQLIKESGLADETIEIYRDDHIEAEADVHAPLLNLPGHLGLDSIADIPNNVPYLKRTSRPAIEARRHIKIGLCWCGAASFKLDHMKACPLEELAPLFRYPKIRWYSLVVGPREQEIERANMGGILSTTITDRVTDFSDTARLMADLDLVITIDSAVAHLAGALGYKVWVMLAHSHCWRYLRNREDSPWYPSMRLFRQDKPNDWQSVMRKVDTALQVEFNLE